MNKTFKIRKTGGPWNSKKRASYCFTLCRAAILQVQARFKHVRELRWNCSPHGISDNLPHAMSDGGLQITVFYMFHNSVFLEMLMPPKSIHIYIYIYIHFSIYEYIVALVHRANEHYYGVGVARILHELRP